MPNQLTTSHTLNRQRGFVLVCTLTLLPIILSAILCCWITTWYIQEKEQLQWNCEKYNLKAQQILIDGAYDLVNLNTSVTSLITQKEQLEIELTVAIGPEKAAIAAQLLIVRGRMLLLRLKQRFIIHSAEARAFAELQKIDLSIKEQIRNIVTKWQKGQLVARIHYRKPKMQVDPYFKDFSLPTYDFGIGYSERQLITVDMQIQGRSPLPLWFTKLLKSENMYWQENCSTQPKQEGGNTWQSYLSAVKR